MIPPDLTQYFSVATAAALAGVTAKRVYQILREQKMYEHCLKVPADAKRPALLIPPRFLSVFQDYQATEVRQKAGKKGGSRSRPPPTGKT